MGYKKLDEVMELLSDELDGFNKSINRLESLTQNVENIKIKPDTAEIERMLLEHLNMQKDKGKVLQESIYDIENHILRTRMIPKAQVWLHYSFWFISLVTISYLAFRVSRTPDIRERASAEGERQVISNLKGYFDQNPGQYQAYQKWIKEKDSVSKQK